MKFNLSRYNSQWQDKRLSELGLFSRGKSKHRPRNDPKLFDNGTYPLIQTGDIKSANLYVQSHQSSYNKFGLSQSKLWDKGTLCITIAANIAETAILDYPMCFPDSVVGFNAYENETTETFMYYVFNYIKKTIQNTVTGSIQDNINIDYLAGLKFKVPTKIYQDKIVDLLVCLDHKIELNNRINAELESMTKLLYDYWFVQFDFPDENGKPYKSLGGKMVYSNEMKIHIPYKWTSQRLVNITDLIRRGVSPKYVDMGGIQVLNQKCIRDHKIIFDESRRCTNKVSDTDERLLKMYDITINSTGVGTLGRVAYVKRLIDNKTLVDSHVTLVRANQECIDPIYLLMYLLRLQPYIESAANGSTGQVELNKSFLDDINVLIPIKSLTDKFSKFCSPIIEQMANNEKENDELIKLRDWLLPMLMNGQVTIK